MKIQILGTGCPKCKRLAQNAETAIRESRASRGICPADRFRITTSRRGIQPALAN